MSIASNNLGDRDRIMTTLFAEHRFELAENLLDITPGLAFTNYTDFGTQFFPGIDIGYRLNDKMRLYANAGYTYRIPTFTDLYYSDPTTLGNENLKPEEALTTELGWRWKQNRFELTTAVFHRAAENLIDYVRASEDGRFEATNIRKVNTVGLELEANTRFTIGQQDQQLTIGYTYLNDDVKEIDLAFSRYSINSLRHHLTLNYRGNITKNLRGNIAIKHAERPLQDPYQVVDLGIQWQLKDLLLSFSANNILNEVYSESNLVPMPLGNGLLGLQVTF